MFRIEVYVENKRLGDVLMALNGIAHVSTPRAVTNVAENKSGKPAAPVAETNGSMIEMFMAWARKTKATELDGKQVGDWIVSIGHSRGSVGYLMRKSKEAGYIKTRGRGRNARYYPVL